MTKDEAMQQALDALENAHAITPEQYDEAITAIKAALAQPECDWVQLFTDPENQPTQYGTMLMREWVGLTYGNIWQAVNDCTFSGDLHVDKFAQAIEAKLKEKNT